MGDTRILTLVRHAKSSWGDPGMRDIERPLNKRGLRDAPRMAEWLSGALDAPDLILSSPARRAEMTAEVIAGAFGIDTEQIRYEEWIYYRGAGDWLAGLQQLDDDLGRVLLVGHNPTVSELGSQLLGSGYMGFATCTACGLELSCDSWALVGDQRATQLFHQSPKDLD